MYILPIMWSGYIGKNSNLTPNHFVPMVLTSFFNQEIHHPPDFTADNYKITFLKVQSSCSTDDVNFNIITTTENPTETSQTEKENIKNEVFSKKDHNFLRYTSRFENYCSNCELRILSNTYKCLNNTDKICSLLHQYINRKHHL